MVTGGPDDLPAPGPEDQRSFTGDGERDDVGDAPPAPADAPLTQPSRTALRAGGDGAQRRILAALLTTEPSSPLAVDDDALARRLIAAVRALPPSSAGLRRQAWRLRAGVPASRALGEWLASADLADGATALVALQLEVVRGVLGDALFDSCFGPAVGEATIARLVVGPDLVRTPLEPLLRFSTASRTRARPLRPGEWYTFRNLAIEVRGPATQDERCLFLGEVDGRAQWAGLGLITDEDTLLAAIGAARPEAAEIGVDLGSGLSLSASALAELVERAG